VKFLLVVVFLAVAIYVVVRLLEQRSGRGGGFGANLPGPFRPNRPNRPGRPIGPDDDPEFLRDLNRRRPKPKPPKDE
jgi:hypothetical protein